MPKAHAVKCCLALLLLFLAGAASAQDSQDRGEELRQAASAGDVAKVKALLDQGVDVNAANSYGGTALTFAARRGNAEMVKLLLERGADPNRGVSGSDFDVRGRILSIYEASDEAGRSCAQLFARSKGAGERKEIEIEIEIGGGHGAFFRPRKEWTDPVIAWVRR